MNGWRECRLGEVAEIQTGPFGSQLHASDYIQNGIPSIMPTNIGSRLEIDTSDIACIKESDAKRLERYLVKEGDVVYSRRGDVEKCAFIDSPQAGFLCGTGCLRIRFGTESVLPKFCAYYLSTDEIKGWVVGHAVGTTMPNLNSSILENVPMLLPPLPEQRAIADVLSSLDDKIDLLQRQNKTLEGMAEALWRKMLVEEEEEPGWKRGKLGDLTSVCTGKGLKRNEYNENGKYPVIGANGKIGRTDKYLTNEKLILTGRVGTLGEIFISNKEVWISDNVLIIKPNENRFFHAIYFLLKNIDFENLNVGSTQPLVTQTDLKNIEIEFPGDDDLDYFTKWCESFFNNIEQNVNQIRTLEKLRNVLLPKLMSGEVRVSL